MKTRGYIHGETSTLKKKKDIKTRKGKEERWKKGNLRLNGHQF